MRTVRAPPGEVFAQETIIGLPDMIAPAHSVPSS
jgi:hypothetical protein